MAYVGVVLMVGLAGIASAVGTSITGQAAVGAMKKNSGAFGSYMILSAQHPSTKRSGQRHSRSKL